MTYIRIHAQCKAVHQETQIPLKSMMGKLGAKQGDTWLVYFPILETTLPIASNEFTAYHIDNGLWMDSDNSDPEARRRALKKYFAGNHTSPSRIRAGEYIIFTGVRFARIEMYDSVPSGYWGRWQSGVGKRKIISDTLKSVVSEIIRTTSYKACL